MKQDIFKSKLHRRSFLISLLTLPITGAAQATEAKTKVLCAHSLYGFPNKDQLLSTSGDNKLDKILRQEMVRQSSFFGFRPGFILYSGSNENAFAIPGSYFDNTDGTILYNLRFLKRQLTSKIWGGAVVSGIIAHEFGHIYQFFSGYEKTLGSLHSTVKYIGLHADFLSGFYMGKKNVTSPMELDDYFKEFYSLGNDDRDNKDFHGTREERYFAVRGGFKDSFNSPGENIKFAAKAGVRFLRYYFQ